MGTTAMLAIGLALFAVFGLFVAFMCVMIEGSWSEVRRKLWIAGEWISVVAAVIILFCFYLFDTLARNSLLAIRRTLLILVLGYGGDVAERLYAVLAGITAGVKSLFHRDEGVYEALDL